MPLLRIELDPDAADGGVSRPAPEMTESLLQDLREEFRKAWSARFGRGPGSRLFKVDLVKPPFRREEIILSLRPRDRPDPADPREEVLREAIRRALGFIDPGESLPESDARPLRLPHPELATVSTRLWLRFDGMDRYQGSAALVMAAGSAGMLIFMFSALGPLWAGFLAGALPTFLLASVVHAARG